MRCSLLGLILSTIVISVNAQGCPDGWLHHGSSCYAFIDSEPDGWIEAMFFCSSVKAKLVEIETESENTFLKTHLQAIGTPHNSSYWIGLSDIIQEGTYVWQTTQQRPDFADWGSDEPNDLHHNEDCIELYQMKNFHWNDAPCSVKSKFICEITLDGDSGILGK